MSERMFHEPLGPWSTDQERARNLRYITRLVGGTQRNLRDVIQEEIIEPLYFLEDSLTRRGIYPEEKDKKRLKWVGYGLIAASLSVAGYLQ